MKKNKKYGPFGPNQEYFSSITAVRKRFNQEMTNQYGYDSQFSADVLFNHHPRYIGMTKSIRFRLKPDRAVLIPDGTGQMRWSTFSFKDIFSPPTWEKIASNQLQKKWDTEWKNRVVNFLTGQTAYFPRDNTCPLCRNRFCDDVDHVYPYHKTIKEDAIKNTIATQLLQDWIMKEWLKPFDRNYDQLMSATFLDYNVMTSKGKFAHLCKPCHRMITAKRK